MHIPDKISKWIYSLGGAVVFGLTALIAVFLYYLSSTMSGIMAYADEHVFFIKDVGPGMTVGILILLLLLSFLFSKHKKVWTDTAKTERILRNVSVVLTVCFALLGILIVKTTHLYPVYDQGWVFQHAGEFLRGDYHAWQLGDYMDKFPFQNGMVLLMMPFAKMGDSGIFVFQYLNVFVLILLNIGLAKISREYFGKVWGYATYIAATMTIQMWGQITYVYGFLWQIAFGIWGIFFMIRYDKACKRSDAVKSIICLVLGSVCKYNGVLFVIAISLIMAVRFLYRKERRLKYAVVIVALIILTFGTLGGIRMYFNKVTGGNPESGIGMRGYIATGISESSIAPGWFNDINTSVYEEFAGDSQSIENRFDEIISERLDVFKADRFYCLRFFARKNASMWAEPAMQCFTNTSIRNLYGTLSYAWKDILYNGGIINSMLYLLMDIGQSCLYFGLILKLYWIFRKKKIENTLEHGELLVLILGGFIYHFIFEAQCYYVLPYFVAMIPYSLKGYGETIMEISENKIKKSGSIRFIAVAFLVGLLIYLVPSTILDSTVRIGNATGEYLWYLQNELDWKDPNYTKIGE